MTVIVYALTAIALLVAACAALGLHRALREDLAYAWRQFRGLRIVIRCGGSGRAYSHKSGRKGMTLLPPPTPLSSTNGHRLTFHAPPTTTITTKGKSHGC